LIVSRSTMLNPTRGVHLATVFVTQPSPASSCRSVSLRGLTTGWMHAAGRRPNSPARTPALRFRRTISRTVSRCTPTRLPLRFATRRIASGF
jgi:hypothetical protein